MNNQEILINNFDDLICDVFSLEPASDFCLEMAERSKCFLDYMSIDHLGISARFQDSNQKCAYLSVSEESGPELFIRDDRNGYSEKRFIVDVRELEVELKSHFSIS